MCNQDFVGVLPVSPMHSHKLGFYSLFAYADRLARTSATETLFGINLHGKLGEPRMLPVLQNRVGLLGISPTFWWLDSVMTQDVIQEVVQTLFDQGLIKKERRQIMRCACGNVEYVSGVVLRGTRKTLLKGEIAACCNSPVTSSDEEALVTAPLPSLTLPETHPSWAASEMRAELDRLEGVQLLISRKTRRIVTVRLEGRSWWLDNDFLWWPYLWKAYQEEAPIRHLVTGASVVRQTCLLLAFSRLIGIPGPHSVHCLPKVHFKSVWGLETPEQLVERFDVSRVQNALIWAALSGRKEFTLQETTISCMNPYIPIDIPLLQSRRMLHV